MPNNATQQTVNQSEEIVARLDRLEASVARLLAAFSLRLQDVLAFVVPDPERSCLEPVEWPAPPWRHLVGRRHPWRQQLYIKGRNMTVRQLVGTVRANQLSPEEAANDLGLPVEAIQEALAYADQNADLLRLETEMEALLLKRGKIRGSAVVPR